MEIGTEILLKRIKDCPEEFAQNDPQGIYGAGKWFSVLNAAKHSLPKEEFDAINEALEVSRKQYLLDKFNEQVLKTLAGEAAEDNLSKPYSMATAAGTNALQNSYTGQIAQQGQTFRSQDPLATQGFGTAAAKREGGLLSSLAGRSLW